jgi:protein-S-isoprenylcysteine O-methyltransferase Ste14
MTAEPTGKNFLPFLMVQLVLVLIVLFLVGFLMPGHWSDRRAIGFGLMILGAVFLFMARFQLGNSFAVTPQARELVTHGLYSKIRNPIYVFSGVVILGLFVMVGKPYLFLVLVVLLAAQTFRAHREAQVLEAKFGDQYREYRKQTWF